jgi:hypothetical protein
MLEESATRVAAAWLLKTQNAVILSEAKNLSKLRMLSF